MTRPSPRRAARPTDACWLPRARIAGVSFSACWAAMLFAATQTSFALLAKKFGDTDPRAARPAHHRVGAAGAGRAVHPARPRATSPRPTSWVTSAGAWSRGCAAKCSARILELPIGYFDRNSSAMLLSRLTYNTEQIGQATTDSVVVVVRTTLTIVASIGLVLWFNVRLGAAGAHHGAAGGVAGVGHQPQVPPLQPPHPGLDGRRHARRQGELRGAAPHQGLQRAGAPRAASSTR